MSVDDLDDKFDPYNRSKWQQITIAIAPKITGFISFVSSSVMIYMIFRSDVKLATPFRRIIFGMCVIDLFQSFSAIVSTSMSPEDTPGIWGAMGNTTTCDISGWIFQFSSTAPPMYICSLSIHYFYFVQYSIKRTDFSCRVEPFLHSVPILWSIIDASYLVATQHINNAEVVCWNASLPYNCINDPSIDCERGENTFLLRAIFNAGPNFIALTVTVSVLFATYMINRNRERKYEQEVNVRNENPQESNLPQDDTSDIELVGEVRQFAQMTRSSGTTFNHLSEPSSSRMSSTGAGKMLTLSSEQLQQQTLGGQGPGMMARKVVSFNDNPITFKKNNPPHSNFSSSTDVFSAGACGVSIISSESVQQQTTGGQGSNSPNATPVIYQGRTMHSGEYSMKRKGVTVPSNLSSLEVGEKISLTESSSNRSSTRDNQLSSSEDVHEEEERADDSHNLHSSSREANNPVNNKEEGERRKRVRVRERSQEALTQSYLFIGSFFASYGFIYIAATIEFFQLETPYFISLAMWIFFPLQGFFNIIVYTRPHVAELESRCTNLTRFKAIWEVIKSGGDSALGETRMRFHSTIRSDSNQESIDVDVESSTPSHIRNGDAVVSSLGWDGSSEDLYGDTDLDIYKMISV